MNKPLVLKLSVGVVSVLAVSLAVGVPQSLAGTPQSKVAYACASGTLHEVTDLKGGDLAAHQTGGDPKFTCFTASKPAGSGALTCAGGAGDLHLVSDLKGGVAGEYQSGTPAHTCLQGSLPSCAPYYVPTKGTGPLTAGGICMPAPPK